VSGGSSICEHLHKNKEKAALKCKKSDIRPTTCAGAASALQHMRSPFSLQVAQDARRSRHSIY